MLPAFASNDQLDALLNHAKFVGDGLLCHAIGGESADLQHFLFAKLAIGLVFTTKHIRSAFSKLIPHVIELSAFKKMGWSYAFAIIAFMQDALPFWYWPNEQPPRDAVGHLAFCAADPDAAITETSKLAGPFPTRSELRAMWLGWAVFIDVGPKDFFRGTLAPRHRFLPIRIGVRTAGDSQSLAVRHFNTCGAM
jgi:hypothetical protein